MRKKKKALCITLSAVMALGACNVVNTPLCALAEPVKEQPANPVYDAATDSTDWDYVYFGSYPQSEVKGDELTDAITGAAYTEGTGYATVDGVQYKALSKGEATYKRDTIAANHDEFMLPTERISTEFYNWYNKSVAYFKVEPIRWKVLQNDGETLLLMADEALDTQKYNSDAGSSAIGTFWATCSLRTWLNETFYTTAFDEAEQAAIVDTTVETPDNLFFGTNGGDTVTSKVYLMSDADMTNTAYGFSPKFSEHSKTRRIAPTDYAQAMGAWMGSYNDKYYGNCWYLLRSTGAYTANVCTVYPSGYVYEDGYIVKTNYYATCPVIRVDVNSDEWTLVGEEEAAARNAELAEGKAAERPQTDTITYGDLDGDGNISLSDARRVLRAALRIEPLTDTLEQMAADVDGDGSIKPLDAQEVLQRAIGLINYFPSVEFDPTPLVQKEYEPTGTLWVAADSICDQHSGKDLYDRPIYGWGEVIEEYLTKDAKFHNTALSSRSTKEFMSTAHKTYGQIMGNMKAGDYLIISFGHNDEHPDIEYYSDPYGDTSEVGSYKWFLKNYYIDPAIRAGVQPVLMTSVVRRYFYDGKLINPQLHSPYAQAMKELAAEYKEQGINIYVIDLHSKFMALYEELGEDGTAEYHGLMNEANGHIEDNTHLSLKGAKQAVEWMLEEMKAQNMSYAKFIKE